MEALPQPVFDRLPDTLEIVYRKQILLGTSVRCLYQRTDEDATRWKSTAARRRTPSTTPFSGSTEPAPILF